MHAHASYIFKKLDIIFTESAMVQFLKCAFFLLNTKYNFKKSFFILLYSFIFLFLGYSLKFPKLPMHRQYIFRKKFQFGSPYKVLVSKNYFQFSSGDKFHRGDCKFIAGYNM